MLWFLHDISFVVWPEEPQIKTPRRDGISLARGFLAPMFSTHRDKTDCWAVSACYLLRADSKRLRLVLTPTNVWDVHTPSLSPCDSVIDFPFSASLPLQPECLRLWSVRPSRTTASSRNSAAAGWVLSTKPRTPNSRPSLLQPVVETSIHLPQLAHMLFPLSPLAMQPPLSRSTP